MNNERSSATPTGAGHWRRAVSLAGAIAALLLLALNLARSFNCNRVDGCVEDYWRSFWLIGYSDGLIRRALLGELVRVTAGSEIDYFTMNLVALAVALAVLIPIPFAYRRTHGPASLLPLVMLFVGPPLTVCFEVLGDPLQMSVLLGVIYYFASANLGPSARAALGLVLGVIAIAIHEAAGFIVVPYLYAMNQVRAKREVRLGAALGLACLCALLVSVASLTQHVHGNGISALLGDGSQVHARKDALPPLREMLEQQYNLRFGSLANIVRTVSTPLRVWLFPCGVLVAFAVLLKDHALPRFTALLWLASSPLYIIASDWGRFSSYSLLLALLLSSVRDVTALPVSKLKLDALWTARYSQELAWVACGMLLATRPSNLYRTAGLRPEDLAYSVAVALLVGTWLYYNRRALATPNEGAAE